MIRSTLRSSAVALLAALTLVATGAAQGSRPASSTIKKRIAEYFGADDARRAELLEFFDTVPPLKKRDAAKWLETVRSAMVKQAQAAVKERNPKEFRKFKSGGVFHVQAGQASMKYMFRSGGKRGKRGVPLYINLHGGGNDKGTNDSAWQSAKGQYGVDGCLVVPRSTQDVALSWAVPEIWPLIDRLLAECFLLRAVDPDRVYVLGYSMGGWGTLLMGPAMADRWAAVGSSAGGEHAQRAHPENLRNTPMIIQIGTEDHMFQRHALSKAYAKVLEGLRAADAKGYTYEFREHEGAGHSISDSNTPKWLSRFTRNPYPEKVVWRPVAETGGHVDTFYYLAVDQPTGSMHLVVTRDGNTLTIEKADNVEKLTILLNDEMADLDDPVIVMRGDEELHSATVERRLRTIVTTFEERADPRLTFSARIEVEP